MLLVWYVVQEVHAQFFNWYTQGRRSAEIFQQQAYGNSWNMGGDLPIMASKKKIAILTYFGIDGACAAAVAFLKYPKARVCATSANRIAITLTELAGEDVQEIHICGVGVYCLWSDLEQVANLLRKKGCTVFWHCGRGYLDDEQDRFNALVKPVFAHYGSNTAALAHFMLLDDQLECQFLLELARLDPNIHDVKSPPDKTELQAEWIDLINAALAQYLKFQDDTVYPEVIRKLSRIEMDSRDRTKIQVFRRMGFKYLLHGRTPDIRRLKERIQLCADADRALLITGESGVGKEHVAHLVWERSKRATGPMIAVNCAYYAGSANMANADLFGHVKGAYTGASGARDGKLVAADGGILFLDELGELPLEVQAKLLRVIEDGWITPVGAERPTRIVDMRIIAATNRNLYEQIAEGTFREDLYHRISTLCINVPPLRQRGDDIPVIVEERLSQLLEEGYTCTFSESDYAALMQYEWPGNVRQLIKIVDRAVMLHMTVVEALQEEERSGELRVYEGVGEGNQSGETATDDKHVRNPDDNGERNAVLDLPCSIDEVVPIKDIQGMYARHVWNLMGQNYSAAARALGVQANTLRYSYLNEKRE